jgi:hypothetical protein
MSAPRSTGCTALVLHQQFVDRRRIELRSPVCKTGVFPLDEQPMAGPAGNAPAFGVLEAPLALRREPVAPRTRIELVSLGRQPSCDPSRITRHFFVSPPRVERGPCASGERRPASGGTRNGGDRWDLNPYLEGHSLPCRTSYTTTTVSEAGLEPALRVPETRVQPMTLLAGQSWQNRSASPPAQTERATTYA